MLHSPPRGTAWRDLACVAAAAVAVLGLAYATGSPGLRWSDEFVYAVVGRNLAEGRGFISNFYNPDAILAKGFPLGDVHMPGHSLLLAASFRLLGVGEATALLPNQLSFILAALILAALSHRAFGRPAALQTAALFLVFPVQAAVANSAMSEPTLVLITVLYLALWCRARTRARLPLAAALGLLLGLGATHRETFLVFLPTACYALWRWPRPSRLRAFLVFGAALAAWMALVFWPLYQRRAPFPHAFSDLVAAGTGPRALLGTMSNNVASSLAGVPWWGGEAWQWANRAQHLTVAVALVVALRSSGLRRELGLLAAFVHAATFAGLALVYPLLEWRSVRMLVWSIPPALVAIGAASWWAPAPRRGRRLAATLFLAAVGGASVAGTRWMARDRAAQHEFGVAYAQYLARDLAAFPPRLMIAPKAYRYGWEAYPVAVVVWDVTDLGRVRALDHRLPIDAIVVREEERRRFLRGLANDAYRGEYQLARPEPFDGKYYLFVNAARRGAP